MKLELSGWGSAMRRRYDDEDERPSWIWRLVKGIFAGIVVCGAAAAAISIFVLPPPAPPPPPQTAENDGEPKVVDGIEVATRPAYFGISDADGEAAGTEPVQKADAVSREATGPIELSGPALVVNAAAYEAEPETPLVAVVLDDTGANPMLHEALFALDMPVTVGVVAGGAGDDATARAARGAGFEVVAELPIVAPGEAEGAVLEYNLPAEIAAERAALLMRRLPMAVAATPPLAASLPPDRGVLKGILETVGPLGFAYVVHGVPLGAPAPVNSSGFEWIVGVSRFTIPSGATAAEAHGVLDRAAAEAEDTGAAIVMAAADEEALLALQLWAGGGAVGAAQLAPLSAVIRRQNGGDAVPAEAAGETAAAEAAADEATSAEATAAEATAAEATANEATAAEAGGVAN